MPRKLKLLSISLLSLAFIVIGLSDAPGIFHTVSEEGTIIAIVNPDTGDNKFTFLQETPINSKFTANITVMNVSYLAGWQVNITWDPTLLRIYSAYDVSIPPDNVFGEYAFSLGLEINPGNMFWMAVMLNASFNHVNVTSGVLFQIRFTSIRNNTEGPLSCDIHFVSEGEYSNYTILGNSIAEAIPFTPLDGVYEIVKHPYHKSTLTLVVDHNIQSKPYWNGLFPTNYTFIVHNRPDSRSKIVKVKISWKDSGNGFRPDRFYNPPKWTNIYDPILEQITFESTDIANANISPGESANFTVYFIDFPDIESKYEFTESTTDIYNDVDVHHLFSYIDTRVPIVTFMFPEEDEYIFGRGEEIWINATVQDDAASPFPSDIQDVLAVLDGKNYSMTNDPESNTWFNHWQYMPEGNHTITIYATDTAGNTGYDVIHFTVDTVSPSVEVLSPQNKTYTISSVPLNFTVSEATSWVGYSLDGQTNATIVGNTTLSGLPNGMHSLTVYARDLAGNVGSSEIIYLTINAQQSEPYSTWIVVTLVLMVVGVILFIYFAKIKKRKLGWSFWREHMKLRRKDHSYLFKQSGYNRRS